MNIPELCLPSPLEDQAYVLKIETSLGFIMDLDNEEVRLMQQASDLARVTVLYVEDEEAPRKKLNEFLGRRVNALYVASNGYEGLNLFKEHMPDIVITDISMPVMSGLKMAEEIKQINKDVPVIVTTAYNDEKYFINAIDIGVDKYIKKPLNFSKLLDLLASLTKSFFLQQELEAAQEKIEEQYVLLRNQYAQIEAKNCTMQEEMEMAATFQQRLLPPDDALEDDEDVELSFILKPCSLVSGDFLIVERINKHRLVIMVVDVMGHGVGAGLVTIEIKTIFEELKRRNHGVSEALMVLNERISAIPGHTTFFTVSYAIYDPETSRVTVASAGGVPFVHYSSATGNAEVVVLSGSPVGILPDDDFEIAETSIVMEKNDVLLFQTDGLIECFNEQDERFDSLMTQKRFIKHIQKGKSTREIVDNAYGEAEEFIGDGNEFDDDITLVAFRKR